MKRSHALRAALVGVAVIAAATSVTAFADTDQKATLVDAADPVQYVGMGDSYASGVGAGDYDDSDCGRSANAYGPLLAAEYSAELDFVACGGATIPEIRSEQLSALSPDVDYVTISVGGNDVGFGGIISTCTDGSDEDCLARIDAAERQARNELPAELAALYADMAEAAPNARIVIVGYPKPFHEKECESAPGFGVAEQRRANGFAEALNAVTADAAKGQELGFADPVSHFDGHGICSPEPYLKGHAVDGAYHPNPDGQRNGYVATVEAAL